MRARTIFISAIAAITCFFICFPLIILLGASLMDGLELASLLKGAVGSGVDYSGIPIIPKYPTLENYVEALLDTPYYYVLFRNSIVIVIGVLLGQFLIATPAAWAFARFRFRFKETLFFIYVLLMMLPFQVVMLPNYLILNSLAINNTLLAIILPGALSAFPVFIMRHFFGKIPESIIESARLDGANELQIFCRIGIPLGAPGIFAALILGFFEYWNLVEQPLAFLHDQALWPLSLFLPSLNLDNIGLVFASAVIAAIPALLIFFIGREYLEQGISSTTSKG